MGMLEVSSTKHCSWLAAASMCEGSHFESFEAGTWGETWVYVSFYGMAACKDSAKITIRRFKYSHFKGSMRERKPCKL